MSKKELLIAVLVVVASIIIAVLPMSFSPIWNGEIPMHRNQYEEITKAFLKGKLSFDYEVSDDLLKMDNPYNPEARIKNKVNFKWDHALYNGKYYMYFGVAPVLFTFLPYQLITGDSLTTYHATQIYVGLYIIGVFLLFGFIRKTFFKDIKLPLLLSMAAIFSILSIWICITQPALYCTAISAGLCASIYSIYFFIKAVYGDYSFNKRLNILVIGAFLGAIIFACRPPLGFTNILLLFLLFSLIKNNKLTKREYLKLLWLIFPYLLVAIFLMVYNYVRFDNPFEFGQAYQLTIADQHLYSSFLGNFNLKKIIKDLITNFFGYSPLSKNFPYININGVFINFPILLYPYLLLVSKSYRSYLKKLKIVPLYIGLLVLPIIISGIDSIFSPIPTYRYYLDIYFVLIISTFIALMIYKKIIPNWKHYLIIYFLLGITFITTVLLIFVPNDGNFAAYYPDLLPKINDFISFWR